MYGNGFIPGLLLSAAALIGVAMIIRWKKYGITFLIVSTIIIILPTIGNEYLEFIVFSTSAILGIAALWGILQLKKSGKSTWCLCCDQPYWADYLFRSTGAIWLFMIILLPPTAGFFTGFRANLYSNGMRCLDARFTNKTYYSYDLYQRILLGDDFADSPIYKFATAGEWLKKAQRENRHITDRRFNYDDELSETVLFLNDLIFTMNNIGRQSAVDDIKSQKDSIDTSLIFDIINGERYIRGADEYYIPNREKICVLLIEAGIYN